MGEYDCIISGGTVIDPANGIEGELDLAMADGRIAAVARGISPDTAPEVYDARGQIVIPGLVDLHAHVDQGTPVGIDADHYCLGRGTTTAVDAGTAGCDTFVAFRVSTVDVARTRVLCLLNISRIGLSLELAADGSERGHLDDPAWIDAEACAVCIEANRDVVVGVKLLLSASHADGGRNEAEAYRQSLEAAAATRTPVLAHHSLSTVSLDACPGELPAGHIYTHCYHGFETTIIDPGRRRVHDAVRAARDRGVLFDVGHGMGSFNWTVGEICAAEGFWPDTLSTDLHGMTCEGPAYDFPTVMTRQLHLGMPLAEVVRCSTIGPAQAIGWQDRIGTLGVGREADVAVLALVDADMDLEDCQGQMRRIHRRLVPRAVWRAGCPATVTAPHCFPNPTRIAESRENWPKLVIRDDSLQ